MKTVITCFCIALVFLSCTHKERNHAITKDSINISESKINNKSTSVNIAESPDSIPDFLLLGQKAEETHFGILQMVNRTDSAGPYVQWPYYGDTISFELIFYPKSIPKNQVDFGAFAKKYARDNYNDFTCFAYVYPMINPDSAKDYHADNTPYPVIVKSYFRKNNLWSYISSKKVNNLSELNQLMIDVMYKNIK